MNSLKRGSTVQYSGNMREGTPTVDVITPATHFNTIQAKLEHELCERSNQAGRDLDHLQELRSFMNELARYKLKLEEKVQEV